MRKSSIYFIYLAVNLALVFLLSVHALIAVKDAAYGLGLKAEMVKKLELTDLCLFTEARYTRHLSQSDFNTPFQDHPISFEHFPSGSIVEPPPHLRMKKDTL
ncbi:MAG: hypothetical protein ABSB95_06130 [Dissulfurispiraceae bacterium]|jgi:hypothetical protein